MSYDFQSVNDGPWSNYPTWHNPVDITVVVSATKTFTVAEDLSGEIIAGSLLVVSGSSSNDGTYTVVSSIYTTATAIVVVEDVPSDTADGTITSKTLPQATGYSGKCYVDNNIQIDIPIAAADGSPALTIICGHTTPGQTLYSPSSASPTHDNFANVLLLQFNDSFNVQDCYISCDITSSADDAQSLNVTFNGCYFNSHSITTDYVAQFYFAKSGSIPCTVDLKTANWNINGDSLVQCTNTVVLSCAQLGFDGTNSSNNIGAILAGDILWTGPDLVVNFFVTNYSGSAVANLGSLDGTGTWTFKDTADQFFATAVGIGLAGTFIFENSVFFNAGSIAKPSSIVFIPMKHGSSSDHYGGYEETNISPVGYYTLVYYQGLSGVSNSTSLSLSLGIG